MKEKLKDALALATAVLVVSALYMVFIYAPTEANMGNIQRIFYFHVSFAWTGFVAFFGTFAGSIMYLIRKKRCWDILAVSSAEIGIAFCLVVLTTGPIWARPVWGAWWTWDPAACYFPHPDIYVCCLHDRPWSHRRGNKEGKVFSRHRNYCLPQCSFDIRGQCYVEDHPS